MLSIQRHAASTSSSRNEQGLVAVQRVQQQAFVGDAPLRLGHRQVQFQRLQFHRAEFGRGEAAHQVEFDGFVRLQAHAQVRLGRVRSRSGRSNSQCVTGLNVTTTSVLRAAMRLPVASEGHAGPAPVVDPRAQGDEGFHRAVVDEAFTARPSTTPSV